LAHFSHHSLFLEIDPNGGDKSGVKGAVGILVEKACFADARIPERQELHQVVVTHTVGELVPWSRFPRWSQERLSTRRVE
jgi:hypothetical protein